MRQLLRRPVGISMLLGGILLLVLTAAQQFLATAAYESSSTALWMGFGGLLLIGLSTLLLSPTRQDFTLLGVSVLISLIALEIGLRMISTVDIDGQVWIFNTPLRPLKIPVNGQSDSLDTYYNTAKPFRVYDPLLGWANGSNATSWQGYQTNSDGLRGRREYDRQPPEETIRIALFGDSFTFGEDVAEAESWGYRLEQELIEQGYRVEVLNFGVGGYGIDQAYLRYHEVGRDFSPDIVILGFQPENMQRNLNIVRSLYTYGLVPVYLFTKPRFILEDNELQQVNSPTLPLDQIITTIEDFEASSYAQHEFFYRPELYRDRWWLKSRLLSLIVTLAGDPARKPSYTAALYDPQGEMLTLTTAIVDQMASEVSDTDALFAIVHLPLADEIVTMQAGESLHYQSLVDHFEQNYLYIETGHAFSDEPVSGYFLPHYTPHGNELITRAVVDALLPYLPDLEE